jgi:hypothetical protein
LGRRRSERRAAFIFQHAEEASLAGIARRMDLDLKSALNLESAVDRYVQGSTH